LTELKKILTRNFSINKIDDYYEASYKGREGLGLSQIGHECNRWLWYQYNNFPHVPPSGRVLRIFQLGELLEKQVKKDLLKVGYNVLNTQKEVKFEFGNLQLIGHIDGIIEKLVESKEPHLWEMKTMSDKYFKEVLKDGYENYSTQYKAQVHAYMLGLKLKNAFITVYNKNTSELYQERIKLKKDWIVGVLSDVFSIIQKKDVPERFCPNEMFWKSKFCDFRKVCWKC
jgi:hypothetical protein